MSPPPPAMRYRRLRAPGGDGQTLVDPPLELVPGLLAQNRALHASHPAVLLGKPLTELRGQARSEVLAAAQRYTRSYSDPPPLDPAAAQRPLLLAGHQPQLFHPGVWFKNFVLAAQARRHGGQALNLLVDSDTLKSAAVRVPRGPASAPSIHAIPLDDPTPELPFEERAIVSRATVESFGARAAAELQSLVVAPLVETFWPLVQARSREQDRLGLCLAQARHQQEAAWGSRTLELPQSEVCRLESFRWFASWLLAELPRVRSAYNQAVADYRGLHRVRSTAHPVPDLAAEQEWIEAPLWVWQAGDPRRRRLFARTSGRHVHLTDRHRLEFTLCLSPQGDARCAVEQLAGLEQRGVRIRTRALLTTLFARLVLGDLFLHGIGGAKYDQVSDAILAALFEAQPPAFLTVTATLRLPIARSPAEPGAVRTLDAQLRRLSYHPEQFLASTDSQARRWAEEKARWIAAPSAAGARERCRAIRAANAALQPWVAARRDELLAARQRAHALAEAEAVLGAREYPFCFFPRPALERLMAQAEP